MYRPFNKILFIICLSPLLFVSLYSMAQQALISLILHPIQITTIIINSFATVAHSMGHMMSIVDQLADYYLTDHDKFYLRTGEIADYVTDVIMHTL